MIKHFVVFLSPGTFFSEDISKKIEDWNVDVAIEMSYAIKERYGATPYGFYFITRERGPDDLDSKITKKSNMYYLGGEVFTLKQLQEINDPDQRILRDNMKINNWDKIIVNTNSWRWTQPLLEGDVVLEYTPRR